MDVSLRTASPSDASKLAPLVAALMGEEGKTSAPPTPAQLAAWLAPPQPAFEALVAEGADGSPLGYLAFYRAFSLFLPGPVLLVENVYVAPDARGGGVGTALLAAAAREALRRGWRRLELNVAHTNAKAVAAYAALGFQDPGEGVRRVDHAALEALAARDRRG